MLLFQNLFRLNRQYVSLWRYNNIYQNKKLFVRLIHLDPFGIYGAKETLNEEECSRYL